MHILIVKIKMLEEHSCNNYTELLLLLLLLSFFLSLFDRYTDGISWPDRLGGILNFDYYTDKTYL